MLVPRPPFLEVIPRGAPMIINIMHATGIENFLCNSTVYVFMDLVYELINEKSVLTPLFKFFMRVWNVESLIGLVLFKESADCLVTHTNYFINYEKKIYGNIIDQDNNPHIILNINRLWFNYIKTIQIFNFF